MTEKKGEGAVGPLASQPSLRPAPLMNIVPRKLDICAGVGSFQEGGAGRYQGQVVKGEDRQLVAGHLQRLDNCAIPLIVVQRADESVEAAIVIRVDPAATVAARPAVLLG